MFAVLIFLCMCIPSVSSSSVCSSPTYSYYSSSCGFVRLMFRVVLFLSLCVFFVVVVLLLQFLLRVLLLRLMSLIIIRMLFCIRTVLITISGILMFLLLGMCLLLRIIFMYFRCIRCFFLFATVFNVFVVVFVVMGYSSCLCRLCFIKVIMRLRLNIGSLICFIMSKCIVFPFAPSSVFYYGYYCQCVFLFVWLFLWVLLSVLTVLVHVFVVFVSILIVCLRLVMFLIRRTTV